jgi:ABC-2 type transport system permease protein
MIRLLGLQARRDRLVLAVWVLGLALLLLVTVRAASAQYGTVHDRTAVLTLALATPVLLAFRGAPDGDTFGSAVHFQSYTWLAVTVALMNTFIAVRHGRGDEAAGRRELLDASPVGRLAAPAASLLLALLADAVFAVLAVGGYLVGGLPLGGAVLSAAGLALTGLAFFGVGLLAGEAMPTSRAANGVAVALALLAYALRAAGDALGRPDVAHLTLAPALPSATSPIGWGEAMLPFTRPTVWPIGALAGLAVGLVAIGFVVHGRREPGASAFRTRAGRATGSPALTGPFGLAWRLQWPTLLAWSIGGAVLAGITPSLMSAVADLRLDDPAIRRVAQSLGHSRADLATAFTAGVLVIVGVLAAAAGTQSMLRAREEEASGRSEVLLAGPVTRLKWLGSWLGVAAAGVVVVLLASATAVALGTFAVGEPDLVGDRVLQTLVQGPSALAITAIAALLVGVVPHLAVAGSWAVFAASAVVGLFGGVLDLPKRVVELSPVGSVPALPTDDWGPTWGIAVAAAVLGALALLAVRLREVAS